jgi:RecA-family ATPase
MANSSLDFALAYARMGWHVLPVWSVDSHGQCRCGRPNDDKGHNPGKHPHAALAPRGHLDASTDEQQLRDWWAQDPEAGIGVSLAASGLLALDIDPRNGGRESLAELEATHGVLHSDCTAVTQGGGEHRLFRADPELSYPPSLGRGLDLKHHGYICVAPTLGPSGDYRWAEGRSPLHERDPAQPSRLPDFLERLGTVSSDKPLSGIEAGTVIAAAQVYDDLRLALQSVPPDCSYDEWVKVLAGLSRLHETDQAHRIARDWSTSSTKAGHTAEAFEAKWASVMRESWRTNYSTVFYLANQYNPQRHDRRVRSITSATKRVNPLALPIRPFTDDEVYAAQLHPRVIVEDYLYADLRNLIAAGGTGKTTLLLHEAVCGALARPIWGHAVPEPFTTVFVTKEDSRNVLAGRLREIMEGLALTPAERDTVYSRCIVIDLSGFGYRLAKVVAGSVEPNTKDLAILLDHCRPVRPDRLVFDPLVSFTVGESRVNEGEQGVVDAARYLMGEIPGMAVEIVHHTGKANARLKATDQYAGRNGSALPDGSRMVTVMTKCSEEEFLDATGCRLSKVDRQIGLRLSMPKMSYAEPPDDIFIIRQGLRFWSVQALPGDERAANLLAKQDSKTEMSLAATKASILQALGASATSADVLDRYPSRSRVIDMPGVVGKRTKRVAALNALLAEGLLEEPELQPADLSLFSDRRSLAGRSTYIAIACPDE